MGVGGQLEPGVAWGLLKGGNGPPLSGIREQERRREGRVAPGLSLDS